MIEKLIRDIYVSNMLVVIIAMIILFAVWLVLGAIFSKKMRIIGIVVSGLSLVAILYITVLSRDEREYGLHLIPFISLVIAATQPETYRSMLMNVFLFLPLGLALPYVFKGGISKRILKTIFVGLVLSASIELVQYIFSLGLAETDDVICNILGTAVGSCAYPVSLIIAKLIRNIRKRGKLNE